MRGDGGRKNRECSMKVTVQRDEVNGERGDERSERGTENWNRDDERKKRIKKCRATHLGKFSAC